MQESVVLWLWLGNAKSKLSIKRNRYMRNNIFKIIAGGVMSLAMVLTGGAVAAYAAEEPVVLPSPVQIDNCGTDNDTIETPEVDGVFYGVYDYSGTTSAPSWDRYGWESGDAILVIAGPADWSAFTETPVVEGDGVYSEEYGNAGWWLPAFTDVPCTPDPVYLPSPVQNDGCGVEADPYAAFDVPTVDGVIYGIYNYSGLTSKPSWDAYGWEPGDAWLIIAGPAEGQFEVPPTVDEGVYVDAYGNAGWWFPAFSDEPCEVTPVRPKWSDPAGAGNATWILTEQEGYSYEIRYPANGRIQVVAIADEGYVFPEGAQTRWGRFEQNL